MKVKENILISFSGGETSAYMLQYILANYSKHNIKIVFANTGEENEETLIFTQKISEYFNCEIVWLQYERLSYKIVDFKTAYRSHNENEIKNNLINHPFRNYISYFGIPNEQNKSCTRDLKQYVINRYLSDLGWTESNHTKAIGIRVDELNRVGKYWYPLVNLGISKQMINNYWSKMPFRLNLAGYEGNCKTCWKKSDRKLVTIARLFPERFEFFKQMEKEFEDFIPETRLLKLSGKQRFFRGYKSVNDIFEMAKDTKIENAIDDSKEVNYQRNLIEMINEFESLDPKYKNLDIQDSCSESCEVFTND
jgi:hypothetical protein